MEFLEFIDNANLAIFETIDKICGKIPALGLVKPLINKKIKNSLVNTDSIKGYILNDDGTVDIDVINALFENIKTLTPFTIETPSLAPYEITIGNGNISFNVPIFGGRITLNNEDIVGLKKILINKI